MAQTPFHCEKGEYNTARFLSDQRLMYARASTRSMRDSRLDVQPEWEAEPGPINEPTLSPSTHNNSDVLQAHSAHIHAATGKRKLKRPVVAVQGPSVPDQAAPSNPSASHPAVALALQPLRSAYFQSATSPGNTTCSICYEDESKGQWKKLPCAHGFHTHCLHEWLRYASTCPICRAQIEVPSWLVVAPAFLFEFMPVQLKKLWLRGS